MPPMDSSIRARKTELRRHVRAQMVQLSQPSREEASARACALLEQQDLWVKAKTVLLYAPLGTELNIWRLLERALAAGKVAALPRFDPETNRYNARRVKDAGLDLEPGRYGVREPRGSAELVALNRLDFILAPGVAYDLSGRRLGRGQGYYDQLLAAARGTACGVAFDEQIVREVPVEPHDSDVNCILTPTRWIEL